MGRKVSLIENYLGISVWLDVQLPDLSFVF